MPEPSSIPPSLTVDPVPSLADLLAKAKDLTLLEQLALFRADQQRRWLLGQPIRVEDYLASLPALQARADVVLDLIHNEVLLREQGGDTPRLEEYLGRFPRLETALRRSFAWQKSLPPLAQRTALRTPAVSTLDDPMRTGTYQEGSVSPSTVDDVRRPAPVRGGDLPAVPGYQIEGVLGRGGMGVVYKARQLGLKRTVALKMILAGGYAGEAELFRFRAEAEAVARLKHPGVVHIYDIGEIEGRPFFSMEFVEGGSLAQKLAGTPQPPRQAAELIEALARAMHAAHTASVVHRDLKPANVLLASGGCEPPVTERTGGSHPPLAHVVPKITDFGLAKNLGEDSAHTQTGAIMGTPSYMAPEQAEGKAKEIGPAADVWALGAILYECLTGRPPFKGATTLETLEQVRSQEPVAPSQLQPTTPRDLETICLKCLQKEPAKRYASAEELADDCGRFLRSEPIRARRIGLGERALKWARRHPAVAALTTALVLVFTIGFAVALVLWGFAENRAALAVKRENEANEAKARKEAALVQETKALSEKEAARKLAVTKQELADREKKKAEKANYGLSMALAQTQLTLNNLGTADALLDDCHPEWRSFEWFLLKQQTRQDMNALGLIAQNVNAVAFSSDGRYLALATDKTVSVRDLATLRTVSTFDGHKAFVGAVVFLPGGRIASGGADKMVRVWNGLTGKELLTLSDHADTVHQVVLSPDGKTLASAEGRSVRLWDAATGAFLLALPFKGFTSFPRLLFTPDSNRLATTGEIGRIRFWDRTTGKQAATIEGLLGQVRDLAYSPDGKTLALALDDDKVYLRALVVGGVTRIYRPETRGRLNSLSFSPEGRSLALGFGYPAPVPGGDDRGGEVRLVDVETGREAFALRRYNRSVSRVAYSPAGSLLATIDSARIVRLWGSTTDQEARLLAPHAQHVTAVAFSPDSSRLATASWNGVIKVWDAATGHLVLVPPGHTHLVKSVSFSPDGKRLASAGMDKLIRIWDAASGQPLLVLRGHRHGVMAVAFSPDGKLLASASSAIGGEGSVRLWDAQTGRQLRSLPQQKEGFTSVAWSPDGKRLAGGGVKSVRVWDPADFRELFAPKGLPFEAVQVAFHPDGKRLAAALVSSQPAAGGYVRVWDLERRRDLFEIKGTRHRIAWTPDGRRLAVVSEDGLRLCDADNGREVLSLPGLNGDVLGVAVSPDGRRLAATNNLGSFFRTPSHVKVWDAPPQPWQDSLTLRSHFFVQQTAFHPDGRRVVSQSSAALKVWDSHTGRELRTLEGQAGSFSALALSPDGKWLASGSYTPAQSSERGELRVWDLDTGAVRFRPEGLRGSVLGVCFAPDSKRLAVAVSQRETADGKKERGDVTIWDVTTGKEVLRFTGHGSFQATARTVEFSPDGRLVLSVGATQGTEAKLWDAATGKEQRTFPGYYDAHFSPDGRSLALTDGSHISIRDTATGAERLRVKGLLFVRQLAYRCDGRVLVAYTHQALRAWDAATGTELFAAPPEAASVHVGLSLSRDGKRMAMGYTDGTIRLRRLPLTPPDAAAVRLLPPASLLAHVNDLAAATFAKARALSRGADVPAALAAYRTTQEFYETLIGNTADAAGYSCYHPNLADVHEEQGDLQVRAGHKPEATTSYRQGLALRERVVGRWPGVPHYVGGLGRCASKLGPLLDEQGKRAEALAAYTKAADSLLLLEKQFPQDVPLRRLLNQVFTWRAMCLTELKRYREALPDWDEAIRRTVGPELPRLRIGRAATRVRAGDHTQAAAEASEVVAGLPRVPVRLYAAARVHGRCAKVVKLDAALPLPERERLAEAYAVKAVALLREAQAAGFFRAPQAVERLPKDKDLDALRGRPDFREFLERLK